jgi:hypothetical protein
MYIEALREFPNMTKILITKSGNAEFQKADVFKKIIWYSYIGDNASMMAIPLAKVKEIIELNLRGVKPDKLEDYAETMEQKADYSNNVDQEELNRFDEELL